MGFRIVSAPSFRAVVLITRLGEDKPGSLAITFKCLTQTGVKAWIAGANAEGMNDPKWLDEVIESWEGPEDMEGNPVPYSLAALQELCETFPASAREIYRAYMDKRMESRLGN